MAGRTIMYNFPRLSGIEVCPFQPSVFWGNITFSNHLVNTFCESPCFYSYEEDFEGFFQACKQAFRITMLRDPVDWLVSAATHYHLTLDELDLSEYWYGYDFPMYRFATSADDEDRAFENIRSMGFGLVEYMEESIFLLLYQGNRTDNARQMCKSLDKVPSDGLRPDNHVIVHRNYTYGTYRYHRHRLRHYSTVYPRAAALLHTRYHTVHNLLWTTL